MGTHHREVTDHEERPKASTIERRNDPPKVITPPAKKLTDGRDTTKAEIVRTVQDAKPVTPVTGGAHVKVGPADRVGASTIQPTTTPAPAPKAIEAKPAFTPAEKLSADKVAAMLETMADDEANYPKEKGGAAQRKRAAWMADCVVKLAAAVLGRGGLDAKHLTDDYNARQVLVSELVRALPTLLGGKQPKKPRFLN